MNNSNNPPTKSSLLDFLYTVALSDRAAPFERLEAIEAYRRHSEDPGEGSRFWGALPDDAIAKRQSSVHLYRSIMRTLASVALQIQCNQFAGADFRVQATKILLDWGLQYLDGGVS